MHRFTSPKAVGAAATAALLSATLASAAHAANMSFATPGDAYTLDPHAINNTFVLSILGNVYEPLVRRAGDLSLEPALASAWKQTDPSTWRFDLRRGVKFQDGSEFNADDVVFSFDRARAGGVKNMLTTIDSLTKVDDYTIDIKTKGPDPILPQELTSWYIMDSGWAEKNNAAKPGSADNKTETFASRNTNGTGPFKVVERDPSVKTIFEKNATWWDKPVHNLDKVTFFVIPNAATRVSALVSGEVDLIDGLPPQDAERIKTAESLKVVSGPDLRVIYLQPDMARDELQYSSVKGKNPFKDVRVRQAMQLAVDVVAIQQKVMRGFSVPTGTLIAKEVNGYDAESGAVIKPDVAKAKALLTEAGYPDGFSVTLDCTNDRFMNDEAICIGVSGSLARIGIKVEPRAQTVGKWAQQINPPGYNTSFSLVGYTPATYDAHNFLQTIAGSRNAEAGRGVFNIGGYSNPKVDELIAQIQIETDTTKRLAAIKQAFQIIKADAGFIPVHQQMIIWGVKKNIDVVQPADGSLPLRLVTVK
ncbi:ABC transporter substrate-binding protein [Microvirga antarctica]|uniref:ABC transporter substrate-binding protein n=1 Tax=Microvirga antarctica TaxID=2819233 RepID=UPI001B30D304|nr:ABC transporter substrate-binding protein [Microvirga antarctica]